MLDYYFKLLELNKMPPFLLKYLKTPSLLRLKNISYFCGMDYASKDIYSFKEPISRYDHSISVALLTYKLTHNKEATLAGLFHDIATPCFSHVIDYMNNDYGTQESTEEYTDIIIKNDEYLIECFKEDNINPDEIINFKKFTIVDNERPKLCADRLDGIILPSISWTKNIEKNDIREILEALKVFFNEDSELEIGFNNIEIAKKALYFSDLINVYCHSKEDNFMMQLLSEITRMAINKGYIKYNDLYSYNEKQIFNLFRSIDNKLFRQMLYEFENIKISDVPIIDLPKIKEKKLNPLVNGKRII